MAMDAKRAKRRSRNINSMLNEDLLVQILNKVDNQDDRKSFSVVCKQWLSVERQSRTSLRVRQSMFPYDLVTRFPNLVDFRTTRELSRREKRQNKQAWYYPTTDTRLEFIAKTCPKLETFVVMLHESLLVQSDSHLGTKGLRALGTGCPKLSTLMFRGCKVVGNAEVDAVLQSAHNLKCLHLKEIYLISDDAFRAIGSSNISTLELIRCPNVTDVGLGFLADGSTSKTLKKLTLCTCDGITDTGIQHLVKMRNLETLELTNNREVTDTGGVAISNIQTLRELKLSEIWKLNDPTVVALAENCRNLEVPVLDSIGVDEPVTGANIHGFIHGFSRHRRLKYLPLHRTRVYEPVTGASIHAFSRHKRLKYLALHDFGNFDQSDVEIVLGCPSLESLVLDDEWLAGNFGLMHGNSARRVVKFESFCDPHPQFMPTVW